MVDEEKANVGAEIMGRGKFGPATRGPWGDDPWRGWWGEDPPFHKPVFVLTHHEREPLVLTDTTFTFVTDGIESAMEQAREAAGDKDVFIGGGADVINQYLAAGLVDEVELHVAPIILGGGARLFDGVGPRSSSSSARSRRRGVAPPIPGRPGRLAPAELRGDVLEDALDRVGVVLDAELVRDRQQERVRRLDRRVPASCLTRTSGSAAYERPKIAFVCASM